MFGTRHNSGITEAAAAATGLGELVSKRIAPISDWTDMGRSEHFVQFYESDEFILNSIAEYVIHGLKSGETCIVAATSTHLESLTSIIKAFGTELDRAQLDGNFITFDATATLQQIMVDGMPDPDLFAKTISSVLTKAVERGNEIRVFGELVGVLSCEGNHEAALKLEELWNGLKKDHRFSLFCAYPMKGLDRSGASEMQHICGSHTRVIPDESYTSLTSADERLRMIACLQHKSRQLEAELKDLDRSIADRQLST